MTVNLTNETRLERVFVFLAYPLLVSVAENSFLSPAVHTDTAAALTSLHQHKPYAAGLTRRIRQVSHILTAVIGEPASGLAVNTARPDARKNRRYG